MSRRALAVVGPGLLVAATGVGAGDLATAAFTGSRVGVAVLWAVLLGAAAKLLLTEGLARWQLVTGETLLEGVLGRAPGAVRPLFLAYFLVWSFLVAAALMSACGAAAHALVPLTPEPAVDKILYGLAHSAAALVLVRLGGFRLFERVMGVAVALMLATVVVSAARLAPPAAELLRGLLVPTVPAGGGAWTVALIGGVGGTVTVLCYGYWIREEGRSGPAELPRSRIDLTVGYAVTALFGLAMVVLGSHVPVGGGGVGLIVDLADALEAELGAGGRLLFLTGAWAAVASSTLGVWQAAPYLFTDLLSAGRPDAGPVDTTARPYRAFLWGLATLPALGLWVGFARMQRLYAIVGALFVPMLAVALLALNGRLLGARHGNRPWTTAALAAILAFFAWLLVRAVR